MLLKRHLRRPVEFQAIQVNLGVPGTPAIFALLFLLKQGK